MDLGRLRTGEWLTFAASVALLVVLFVPWYARPDDASAWQGFSVIDLLLALTAAVGVALAVATVTQRAPALPVALAVIVTGLAIVMALVVAYRLLDQPGANDAVEVRAGAYLGLLAVLGVAAGGWRTMADERQETDTRPLVPAQPAPPAAAAEGSVVARGVAPEAAPRRE